jgi:hypothetical protein
VNSHLFQLIIADSTGLGSCLPRLGLNARELDDMLHRADTDSAYEVFLKLKASRELEAANPGIQLGEVKRQGSGGVKSSKRKRTVDEPLNPASTSTSGSKEKSPGPSSVGPNPPDPKESSQSETLEQTLANYAYLFPDLDSFGTVPTRNGFMPLQNGWQQTGSGNPYNSTFDPSPYPMANNSGSYPANQTQQTQSSAPYNFGSSELSGFGLTIPASYYPQNPQPPLPTSRLPPLLAQNGPAQYTNFSNRSSYEASPSSHSISTSSMDELERQRRLRAAVANLTSTNAGETTMDDPDCDLEESERFAQRAKEVTRVVADGETSNRQMDAVQVSSRLRTWLIPSSCCTI